MTLTLESKISLTKNTLLKEFEGDAILLNLKNSQYYRLDQESLHMFNLIQHADNLGSALKTICDDYAESPEKVWPDLVSFVTDLEKSGIVQVSNE